jgi:hypothetical protein
MGGAVRRCGRLAVVALAAVALTAASGHAQPRVTSARAVHGKEMATEIASGPLLAVVSLSKQRISVHGSAGLIAQSPVSTGMAGYRTPAGVFSILQRSRYHRSNIYSNAPMPYMQRLTWSGVALHAGVLPGYPASHGCIRLPHQFAVDLWGKTKIGTRVVVAPDDAPPVPIEHPRLPAPKLTPAPADEGQEGGQSGHEGPASAHRLKVADASGDFEPSRAALLDPLQRARTRKAVAAAQAADTAGAAKLAIKAAAAKAAAARQAAAALRTAERALLAARRRHDAATRAVARASSPAAAERAGRSMAAAEAALAHAEGAADEAWLLEAVLRQEGLEAETAAAEAGDASRAAAAALKAAERAVEPISIFVSRKTGRVYIRQAWVPVHEAPVTFTDAASPLGTHLYLALGPGADGEALRWLAASLPAPAPRLSRHRSRPGEPMPTVSRPGSRGETAATALARFELAEETKRFIADRLWPGASLIVSEHGGSETGAHTDFIVLAR